MPQAAFALYTVILLSQDAKFLLLKRSPQKRLFPGRWTGVGGRVEPDELTNLTASAWRELFEETGLTETEVSNFRLRRVLYHNRAGGPHTGLLYFTGEYKGKTPLSPDGELYWKAPHEFSGLDIIETTAHALPYLVEDVRRDPGGGEPVKIGVAHYQADGDLSLISWSSPPVAQV